MIESTAYLQASTAQDASLGIQSGLNITEQLNQLCAYIESREPFAPAAMFTEQKHTQSENTERSCHNVARRARLPPPFKTNSIFAQTSELKVRTTRSDSHSLPGGVKFFDNDVLDVFERQPLVSIAQLAPARFAFWGIGVSDFSLWRFGFLVCILSLQF
jgi:hypothetical protein